MNADTKNCEAGRGVWKAPAGTESSSEWKYVPVRRTALEDCTSKGGTVITDNQGTKACKDVQDNALADTGKKKTKPNIDEKPGADAGMAVLRPAEFKNGTSKPTDTANPTPEKPK